MIGVEKMFQTAANGLVLIILGLHRLDQHHCDGGIQPIISDTKHRFRFDVRHTTDKRHDRFHGLQRGIIDGGAVEYHDVRHQVGK